jgi:hypothetical protein
MSKSFTLYGQSVEFSKEQVDYNGLRTTYHSLAIEFADKYMSEYYAKYNGLDGFAKYGLQGGWQVIVEALTNTIQILVNSKIYHIDEKSFVEQYGDDCFAEWLEAFEKIDEQYAEIALKAEVLDAYRTERRHRRGMIIGGGFGLEGAVKGMTTAAGINIASGAIHGAFNLVGKGFSMIGDSMKKSKIFNSEKTKRTLWNGIYHSVFNIHYALCKILGIQAISSNDIRMADTLFNNLDKMQKEDASENIRRIFLLNPYKVEAYQYCIKSYGDHQGETQTMAHFFGINVEPFKNNLLENVYKELNLSTEQDALNAKMTLQAWMSSYGLQTSKQMEELVQKLRGFDKIARTVDGEIFPTRELAQMAAQDLSEIKKILGNDYKESEEKVQTALGKLRQAEFHTSLRGKYIYQLEQVAANFEKKSRTYKGKVYTTKERAELAGLEEAELEKIKRTHNTEEMKGILTALDAINRAGFQTNIKDSYIKQLEDSKQKHMKEIKEYEEQYGNKGSFGRFLQVLLEMVISGGLMYFFYPRWGWIGKALAAFMLIGLISMWVDRRKTGKIRKQMKRQEEQSHFHKGA